MTAIGVKESAPAAGERIDTSPERARFAYRILLLSAVIIITTIIWGWKIGLDANHYAHEAYHLSENLEGIRGNVDRLEAEAAAKANARKAKE